MISILHQGVQNGLLGVEPVLGLVEDHAVGALDDLVGDLLSPVGGEAVHHNACGLGDGQQLVVDLVGLEQLDGVLLRGLVAHGDPGVGVQHIGIHAGLLGVVGRDDLGSVGLGDLGSLPHDLGVGHAAST